MPARKCRGNSSYRHLAPVRLSLMSRGHSTAAPSPSRYGKRYEVEGRTNFLELRTCEVRLTPSPRSVESTLSGHTTAARYHQSLMYDGLRTPDALHKKPRRIGR